MMAYNSAIHASTNFTPYFPEHGREMRLPVNLVATPVPEPGYSQTASEKRFTKDRKWAMTDGLWRKNTVLAS